MVLEIMFNIEHYLNTILTVSEFFIYAGVSSKSRYTKVTCINKQFVFLNIHYLFRKKKTQVQTDLKTTLKTTGN